MGHREGPGGQAEVPPGPTGLGGHTGPGHCCRGTGAVPSSGSFCGGFPATRLRFRSKWGSTPANKGQHSTSKPRRSGFNFRTHDGLVSPKTSTASPWNSPVLLGPSPACTRAPHPLRRAPGCECRLRVVHRVGTGSWAPWIRRRTGAPRPAGRTCSVWPTAGCRRKNAAGQQGPGGSSGARPPTPSPDGRAL